MNKFKRFILKIKSPPAWVQTLTHITALISSVGSILAVIFIDAEGALSALSYALFCIAGISLTYSVYLIIIFAPTAKKVLIAWTEKRAFTKSFIRDFGFRTMVFAIISFIFSLAFSAFNAYMGIRLKSIWYGALAGYYIFLAFFRGSVLLHRKRKFELAKQTSKKQLALSCAVTYRTCGIILLALNIALSSAIAQMIFAGAYFNYPDLSIFAYAAYAFFKITSSIINIVKAKRQDDLTVQAIRIINLAGACVSILALQTALLNAFATPELNLSLFNTLTGIIVSATVISLGVYMIVHANKIIKNLRTEKNNGRE